MKRTPAGLALLAAPCWTESTPSATTGRTSSASEPECVPRSVPRWIMRLGPSPGSNRDARCQQIDLHSTGKMGYGRRPSGSGRPIESHALPASPGPVSKVVALGLVSLGIGLSAEPAAAHRLSLSTALTSGRGLCAVINKVAAEVNPYTCDRAAVARRRSVHAIDLVLRFRDPKDGERCTGTVRVAFRGARTYRWRTTLVRHTCRADPFRTKAPPSTNPTNPPSPQPGYELSETDAYEHTRSWGEYMRQNYPAVYSYEVGPCARQRTDVVACRADHLESQPVLRRLRLSLLDRLPRLPEHRRRPEPQHDRSGLQPERPALRRLMAVKALLTRISVLATLCVLLSAGGANGRGPLEVLRVGSPVYDHLGVVDLVVRDDGRVVIVDANFDSGGAGIGSTRRTFPATAAMRSRGGWHMRRMGRRAGRPFGASCPARACSS